MTDWPENDAPVGFDELTGPVMKVIREYYDLTPSGLFPTWEGLPLPTEMRATCLGYEETLTGEYLEYAEKEQGRSPLETMLGIAVQLGIEQGRRIEASKGAVKYAKLFSSRYRK